MRRWLLFILLLLAASAFAYAPVPTLVLPKLYGPDFDGVCGGQNGTGGLEAIKPGTGAAVVLITDALGNAHKQFDTGSSTLSLSSARPTACGAVPGREPVALGYGGTFAETFAWRGKAKDITGMYWIGMRYYEPESGSWLSFDPVWNLADANGYSFCGGDPVNCFDADGRLGKRALNWATGIDLDSNVPLGQFIQAHRQGGAEYLWTTVPGFVDAVVGSVLVGLFTPTDLVVLEQRAMGVNTPEVQVYNHLAQIVHEHVGSPLARLGVYDPGSADAQWGRDLGELVLFVGLIEGARSQIYRQPATYLSYGNYGHRTLVSAGPIQTKPSF